FLQQDAASNATPKITGTPATLETAIVAAAKILGASRAPLIYGLSTSSTAGQRAACRLADRLGATIDTTCHAFSLLAVQAVGESTATLGEVRNRSDLVVYWGSNPLESHPRHVERCVDARGMFVPGGRQDRQLIVIDVRQTATAEIADRFVQVKPGKDFDLIWALRAVLKGEPLDESGAGGVAREAILKLADALKSCRYGAIFFGLGLTQDSVPHATVEALLSLVTELNNQTRFVVQWMRGSGDLAGADNVLCWQTGFPSSINLARGYPRYNPGEYTADALLERREVDSVLLVGSEGIDKLSEQARQHLRKIPKIVLDRAAAEERLPADVAIPTAIYGVHRPGTAYRMDEVPIPLRIVLPSKLPSDAEVLQAISAALPAIFQV
ncbi:MAG: formylmethanofuran dehydrogenase subunit B, partial [Pirellulales bacterium]|nr:formylmethanofuran dehydrogenase subunit B [Pirellulales bacterium]